MSKQIKQKLLRDYKVAEKRLKGYMKYVCKLLPPELAEQYVADLQPGHGEQVPIELDQLGGQLAPGTLLGAVKEEGNHSVSRDTIISTANQQLPNDPPDIIGVLNTLEMNYKEYQRAIDEVADLFSEGSEELDHIEQKDEHFTQLFRLIKYDLNNYIRSLNTANQLLLLDKPVFQEEGNDLLVVSHSNPGPDHADKSQEISGDNMMKTDSLSDNHSNESDGQPPTTVTNSELIATNQHKPVRIPIAFDNPSTGFSHNLHSKVVTTTTHHIPQKGVPIKNQLLGDQLLDKQDTYKAHITDQFCQANALSQPLGNTLITTTQPSVESGMSIGINSEYMAGLAMLTNQNYHHQYNPTPILNPPIIQLKGGFQRISSNDKLKQPNSSTTSIRVVIIMILRIQNDLPSRQSFSAH